MRAAKRSLSVCGRAPGARAKSAPQRSRHRSERASVPPATNHKVLGFQLKSLAFPFPPFRQGRCCPMIFLRVGTTGTERDIQMSALDFSKWSSVRFVVDTIPQREVFSKLRMWGGRGGDSWAVSCPPPLGQGGKCSFKVGKVFCLGWGRNSREGRQLLAL